MDSLSEINDELLFEKMFNIFLVSEDARIATLVEMMDFKYGTEIIGIKAQVAFLKKLNDIQNKIISYASSLDLITCMENWQLHRLLVIKPEKFAKYYKNTLNPCEAFKNDSVKHKDGILGNMLGFTCAGHDFANLKKDRLILNIYINYKPKNWEFSIITEVCEKNKIIEDKLQEHAMKQIQKIQKVIDKYNLEMTIRYDIRKNDSVNTRMNALKNNNLEYIQTNIMEYINDLNNFWIENSKLGTQFTDDIKENDTTRFPMYAYIWEKLLEIDIDTLGKTYDIKTMSVDELKNQIQELNLRR